jgi:hypothetical protein
MPTYPVEGEQYTKYGTSRSGAPFRKVPDTGAQVTWGVVRKNKFKGYEGEYVPHETQSREEQQKNWVEKEEETRGLRWNVFDTLSANGVKLVRTDSNEQLEIALKNATLNKQANQLTVCNMMSCVVYALTAAGAAFVAAKLAGLAGGKKSRTKRRNKSKRNKSKRNKSKRNKSKHNKSKKNKRRSIRRR